MRTLSGAPRRLGALLVTAILAAPAGTNGAGPVASDQAILHVLSRAAFGARPGDVEALRATGIAAYVDAQLYPGRLPDPETATRLSRFSTLDMSTSGIIQTYARPLMAARRAVRANAAGTGVDATEPATRPQRDVVVPLLELQQQKLIRAVHSSRQLQEVLTDFWFNHFNVDARKGVTRFLLTEYERDAIRPHVLGRFRDLLGATAQSPAMLFYLDNWMSADPGRAQRAPSRRRPTAGSAATAPRANAPRGLNENYGRELLELHTLGVDGGYTQKDVTEVARAFTGWTLDRPRLGPAAFRFDPRMHDDGEKTVLGQRVRGTGKSEGDAVLDLLARHPATARFIAGKLVRRFVSDAPPPALVDRAAARFSATDGDLREVMRTILTAPEFLAPAAYRAKTRTPFEFVVAAVRATGSELDDAAVLVRQVRALGMPLYQCQPPTGYADTADAWTNAGALIGRMNFAQALAQRPATLGLSPRPTAHDVVSGELSAATRSTIAKATTAAQRVALTLGSPEFQKR